MDSHDDFAAKRQAHRDRIASPPVQATAEFDDLCARIFTTPDGRALLPLLRSRTVDRPINPFAASESALRALAAQSQFVRDIETARDRGLETMKTKGK